MVDNLSTMPPQSPPAIIDIEASGFGHGSYPIEVGAILRDGTKYCSLILPSPDWTHWDEEAEKLHHITRDILQTHGKPIAEVVRALNEILRNQTAYSDGWGVDKTWLDHLFYTAGIRCEFSLSSLEMILSEPQMEIWHETKDQVLRDLGQKRHRASFDAQVIQETYQRTRQATDRPPCHAP
jgi:DNA polymerase III epsilon subunit-like protein